MSEPNFEASEPSAEVFAPTSMERTPVRKHEFNIYTMMLIISFVCLLIGTLLLLFEVQNYGSFPGGFPWKTNAANPSLSLLFDLMNR